MELLLVFELWMIGLGQNISPAREALADFLSIPPKWEERLIYYHSFERMDGQPDVNRAGLRVIRTMEVEPNGVRGHCGMPTKEKALELRGEALSPHRPITLSFWWALQQDAEPNSGFGLFHLTNGSGFLSHFTRGGPWCALEDTAGVFQVYYLPDIQNVNGIYDYRIRQSLSLKAGVWHHTAIVIFGSSLVSVYTDGHQVYQVRIKGRRFSESDRLYHLILGSPYGLSVLLDEVMIFHCPLSDGEIADYFQAIQQMCEISYPFG